MEMFLPCTLKDDDDEEIYVGNYIRRNNVRIVEKKFLLTHDSKLKYTDIEH